MFTGIVEGPGEIVDVADTDGGRRLRIRTDLAFDDLHHGQSIAVSGVCLTVEAFGDDWFEVFLAAETVEKTYLGDVGEGDRVNLERALAADDRFDGHIVQGHVDGTTTVTNVERVGDDWFFEFDLPEPLASYVVQKGSVCLDGISLTVADRREDSFAVAIIPTTYDLTTLSEKEVGDPIHVEVDVVAKYVESMLDGYAERLVAE
ncbi:riboflavin synthase [Haloferax sp. Atlit-10N]|uniref:Riboflavin synthase n=1 Tax=Haloferax prahovense (strain DSM 18310 / JCM 13924 / TL6) TaxID=1227461 RepID=M0GR96_HALPT|nr:MULTISPECIES: riboflavin synthase [Haloferax]ELZ74063.1 riboflavin synthase subunit alpha [Haloferax prahovense DSM 18310]RDZ46197.1 riboflavin synthase [Haloferax sp. Atlit-16N]RDZ60030.1 riboflavin synthase [Haloferax sp. Atlit-10N]